MYHQLEILPITPFGLANRKESDFFLVENSRVSHIKFNLVNYRKAGQCSDFTVNKNILLIVTLTHKLCDESSTDMEELPTTKTESFF